MGVQCDRLATVDASWLKNRLSSETGGVFVVFELKMNQNSVSAVDPPIRPDLDGGAYSAPQIAYLDSGRRGKEKRKEDRKGKGWKEEGTKKRKEKEGERPKRKERGKGRGEGSADGRGGHSIPTSLFTIEPLPRCIEDGVRVWDDDMAA